MNKRSMGFMFVALLVALAIVLVSVQLVAAQESDNEVEITGTIVSIANDAGTFDVETEEGIYTVIPGDEFVFSSIQIGDTVEVDGTLNDDGSISASKIKVEEQEDEADPVDEQAGPTDERDDPSGGYYCVQSDVMHPFAERLLEAYGTDYETLQTWFCDGFGWGQIMLALQTSQVAGDEPAALLGRRRGGEGWGQIWQDMKLIGRPEDAGPPNDRDGNGRPDFAGPPNDADGDGRPDFAGPPNDADGDGRPDFAGPPNDADGDGRPDFAGPPNDADGDGRPDFAGPPGGGGRGRP